MGNRLRYIGSLCRSMHTGQSCPELAGKERNAWRVANVRGVMERYMKPLVIRFRRASSIQDLTLW